MTIGVHSPYTPHDRDRAEVEGVVKDYGIHEPVYIDNDMAFINAIGAEYHPTFVLVDRQGRVRMGKFGAMTGRSMSAKQVEAEIQKLLAEK